MTHSPNASAIKWEIEQEFPLEPTTPQYEVGDIFRDYGPAYIEAHPLNTVYAGITKPFPTAEPMPWEHMLISVINVDILK